MVFTQATCSYALLAALKKACSQIQSNRKQLGNFCNYVGRIRFLLVIYLQMVLSLHTVIEMLSGKPGQVSNSCEQGLGSDLMV